MPYELRSSSRSSARPGDSQLMDSQGSQGLFGGDSSFRESQIRHFLAEDFNRNSQLPFLNPSDIDGNIPGSSQNFFANGAELLPPKEESTNLHNLQPFTLTGMNDVPARYIDIPYIYAADDDFTAPYQYPVSANGQATLEAELRNEGLTTTDRYGRGFVQKSDVGLSLSQPTASGESFSVLILPQTKKTNMDFKYGQDSILYAKPKVKVPFLFQISRDELDQYQRPVLVDLDPSHNIRVSLKYVAMEHEHKPVERCPVHKKQDESSRFAEFIVQPEKADDCTWNRENLTVTFSAEKCHCIEFVCYSSCAGGIDRKAMKIVFEHLDQNYAVVNETSIGLKLCANPCRDAQQSYEKAFGIKAEPTENGCGSKKRKKELLYDDNGEPMRKTSRGLGLSPSDPLRRSAEKFIKGFRPGPIPKSTSAGDARSPMTNGIGGPLRAAKSEGAIPGLSIPRSSSTGKGGVITREQLDIDDNEHYTIEVRGGRKYYEIMKFVETLEKNERYEARKNRHDPLHEVSQLTPQNSVERLLEMAGLHTDYFGQFVALGIETMGHLMEVYTASFFRDTIQMSDEDAAVVDRIYCNWANVSIAENLKREPIPVNFEDSDTMPLDEGHAF